MVTIEGHYFLTPFTLGSFTKNAGGYVLEFIATQQKTLPRKGGMHKGADQRQWWLAELHAVFPLKLHLTISPDQLSQNPGPGAAFGI